jgi:predicted membrane channel-forming protein YqfA (hemolysin III family)
MCAMWDARVAIQHFGGSILGAIILPLTPLGAEYLATDTVSVAGWIVTAIVFCASLAVYSQNAFIFMLSFLIIMGLAFLYGLSIVNSTKFGEIGVNSAIAGVIFYSIAHIFYRFDFHITKGNDFLRIRSNSKPEARK